MSDLKTVDIKGKAYVTVSERLKYFREHFKGYSLTTEVVYHRDSTVFNMDGKDVKADQTIMLTAYIKDKDGNRVAQGTAFEREGSNYINKTSFVENCETSAWGRALANFGIGIDSNVASADEVANAIKQS